MPSGLRLKLPLQRLYILIPLEHPKKDRTQDSYLQKQLAISNLLSLAACDLVTKR